MLAVTGLMGLLLAGSGRTAQADVIISLVPGSQVAGLDTPFSVDIVASNITGASDAVGAFAATLSFDDSLIIGDLVGHPANGFTVDPDNKMAAIDASFGFGAGGTSSLDLFFSADPIAYPADGAALFASEGDHFTLATIYFTSLFKQGLTKLTLSDVVVSDAGGSTQDSQASGGSVCVSRDPEGAQQACSNVPEPGLMSLFGAGIAAFVARRRRSRAE